QPGLPGAAHRAKTGADKPALNLDCFYQTARRLATGLRLPPQKTVGLPFQTGRQSFANHIERSNPQKTRRCAANRDGHSPFFNPKSSAGVFIKFSVGRARLVFLSGLSFRSMETQNTAARYDSRCCGPS